MFHVAMLMHVQATQQTGARVICSFGRYAVSVIPFTSCLAANVSIYPFAQCCLMSPNVCVPSTTTYVEFVNDLMTALLPTNVVGTGVAKIIHFFKQQITPIPSTNDMIKQMRHPYPPRSSHTPPLTQTFSNPALQ